MSASSVGQSFASRRVVFISHLDRNLYHFRLPLLTQLVSMGNDVWVLVPSGEYDERWGRHGIKVAHYRFHRGSLNPFSMLWAVMEIAAKLQHIQPDLVHTFTVSGNLLGTLGARLAGIRCVINSVTGRGSLLTTDHNSAASLRLRARLARAVVRQTAKMVRYTIFQNPDDQDFFLRNGLARQGRSMVIRGSGVNISEFDSCRVTAETREETRSSLGIEENDLVIMMIGRLIHDKGVLDYLAAAEIVTATCSDVRFLLVGQVDPGNPSALTKAELKQLSESPGVTLIGKRMDVRECLAVTDIFVLPSLGEGLPMSTLEAMAMSLPVVTIDAPGCRETVRDGYNGYLVPPRSSTALADRILKLLGSAESRAQMGSRSRRMAVRHFSRRRVVQAHMRLYTDLLS